MQHILKNVVNDIIGMLVLAATFNAAYAFNLGDRVLCTADLNVHTSASTSGTLVTTEAAYSEGTIENATAEIANGYTWWYITWNDGHSGWSVQDFLQLIPPAPIINIISPNPITADASDTAQTLTINGENFVSTPTVFVTYPGGSKTLSSSEVTFVNSSLLTMTIQLGATAGSWTVQTSNPSGQSSNTVGFTVNAPPPAAPTVSTLAASSVTSTSVQLNGSYDSHGLVGTIYFQYGATTNYGSTTPAGDLGPPAGTVTWTQTGLTPNTAYHYRVVATTSGGTTNGLDVTFNTSAPPISTVTLTLYVHNGSATGPLLSGVQVAGSDGAGQNFDFTTNANGYVTITGTPGTWQFTATQSGYETNSWSQTISATAERDAFLIPNTTAINYSVTVSQSPNNAGTVAGAGSYPDGTNVSISAAPNQGFTFTGWTVNGVSLGLPEQYSFTIHGNETLVANFSPTTNSVLQVTPQQPISFGSVEIGRTADQSFTLSVVGSSPITGTANVQAPFTIVSGGSYTLQPGQTQTVTVRYTPTTLGSGSAYVSFTGGSGANRQVLGTGIASANPVANTGSISGIVTDAQTGLPINGVAISLYGPGTNLLNGGSSAEAITSGSGAQVGGFTINGLTPANYQVLVVSPVDSNYSNPNTAPITISAGQTTSLNIELTPIAPASQPTTLSALDTPVVLVRGLGADQTWGSEGEDYWLDFTAGLYANNFTQIWDCNEPDTNIDSIRDANGNVINGEETIEYNADQLFKYLQLRALEYKTQHSGFFPPEINFVTHSMGGLIVRKLLSSPHYKNGSLNIVDENGQAFPLKVNMVVMLAPLNAGSYLADALYDPVSIVGWATAIGAQVLQLTGYRNIVNTSWKQFGISIPNPDWNSTINVQTKTIRDFSSITPWPNSIKLQLFAATGQNSVGTTIGNSLIQLELQGLELAQSAEDVTDGAVTRPSVDGVYYVSLSSGSLNVDSGSTISTFLTTPKSVFKMSDGSQIPTSVTDFQLTGQHLDHLSLLSNITIIDDVASVLQGNDWPNVTQDISPAKPDLATTPSTPTQLMDSQAGTVPAGNTAQFTVVSDAASVLNIQMLADGTDVAFKLQDPSGNIIDPATPQSNTSVQYTTTSGNNVLIANYSITNPTPGAWTVIVDGTAISESQVDYLVTTSGDSNVTLVPQTTELISQGQDAVISCALADISSSPAVPVQNATITATVQLPDGTTQSLALLDDGQHSDGAANDGVYAALLPNLQEAGEYSIAYSATVNNGQTPILQRVASGSFNVSSGNASIFGTPTFTPLDTDGDGVADLLQVSCWINPKVAGNYILSGQLVDDGNTLQVPASAQFYADGSGAVQASLFFDLTQIKADGLSGNFHIENLQLFEVPTSGAAWVDTYQGTAMTQLQFNPIAPTITSGMPPIGNVGQNYTFSFTATGSPAPSFSLATGSDALPPGLALAANGDLTGMPTQVGSYTFTVQAANGVEPAATQTVNLDILTVAEPPNSLITTQPQSQIVAQGNPVTFTASTAGTGVAYQWQKDGVDIPGATSANYTINAAQVTDTGNYSVVVSEALATGLAAPSDLVLSGNTLYFTDQDSSGANGAIEALSTTGTPVTPIAFDTSIPISIQTGSSQTLAYTVSGANPFLIVGVLIQGNFSCTGATYNGVPMIQVGTPKFYLAANENVYTFMLLGPPTGTHNIVATYTGTGVNAIAAASYTGVAAVGTTNVASTTFATTLTNTVTTTTAGEWLVGYARTAGSMVANANTTIRQTPNNINIVDSNGAVFLPGSNSIGVSQSGTSGDFMYIGAVALKPASNVTTLATGLEINDLDGTRGVDRLQVLGSNIYGEYGGYNVRNIFRIPVTGGSSTTLASFNLSIPGDIFVGVIGSSLYDMANFGTLESRPSTGGAPTPLGSYWSPNNVFDSNAIYLVDTNASQNYDVMRYDLTSNQASILIGSNPDQGNIFADTANIYLNLDGNLDAVAKTGGAVTTLVSSGSAYGYVSDGDLVYFVDGGYIKTIPVAGGPETTLAAATANGVDSMATDGTFLYWIDTSGGSGAGTIWKTVVSSSATLALSANVPPSFITQPVNQVVTAGQSVTFTVAASASPAPTYQWQVSTDGGQTWNNVSGAIYTGGTDATLTVNTPPATLLGNQYRAVVASAGKTAVSTPAPLVVGTSSAKLTWLQNNFTADQLGNPAIVGDSAQPIGDGVPNLIKYAFNLNPWENGQPFLPQPTMAGGNLMLTFNAPQSDLTYTVQASTDLVNWDTTDVTIQTNGTDVTASYTIGPASAFPHPGSYAITDLGTINGGDTYAYAVNANGHVAGRSGATDFLWTPNTGMLVITDNAPAPASAPFMGLNDSDEVVTETADNRAFLWSQGAITNYFSDPGTISHAFSINDAGEVVGGGAYGGGFSWLDGTFTYLPTFPPWIPGEELNAFPMKVNASGNIVGLADNPQAQTREVAIWQNGGTTIQSIYDSWGSGATLNDLNHVAAYVTTETGSGAFLWKGNSLFVDLGDLGGGGTLPRMTIPTGINNADIVVGTSYNSSGQLHAFIWADANGNNQTDPGEMMDINSLLPDNSGWVIDDVEGINDSGVIVGSGLHNGLRRAYIMPINIAPSNSAFLRIVVAPSP